MLFIIPQDPATNLSDLDVLPKRNGTWREEQSSPEVAKAVETDGSIFEVQWAELATELATSTHDCRRGTDDFVVIVQLVDIVEIGCKDVFEDLEAEFWWQPHQSGR